MYNVSEWFIENSIPMTHEELIKNGYRCEICGGTIYTKYRKDTKSILYRFILNNERNAGYHLPNINK